MRRALPVLIVALLVSAACGGSDDGVSTGEGSASLTTLSAGRSTAATSEPDGTTTVPGPTTSGPATTSTTAVDTTTTTAAAPPPVGDPTSLVIARLYAIGAWDGHDWDQLEEFAAENIPAEDGDTYQVSLIGQPTGGTTTGGAPEETCEPIGIFGVPTFPELDYEYGEANPIAVRAEWDIAPRTGEILNPIPSVYRDVARDFLISRGIADPVVQLQQVVKVDLEGDGVDEVILVAERFDEFFQVDPGEYSFALLRKVIEGEVQTAVLGASIVADDGDTDFFLTYRLSSVADLNGDGQLEIITNETYYEGTATFVWEYINDALGPIVVISGGCGA